MTFPYYILEKSFFTMPERMLEIEKKGIGKKKSMPSVGSEPEEVLHALPHAPLVFPRTFLHHRPSLGPQQVFAGVVVVKRPDGGGGLAGEFSSEAHGRDAA